MKDKVLTIQFLLYSIICFSFAIVTGLRGYAWQSLGFGILSAFCGITAYDDTVKLFVIVD